jgi:hypothetical protein
MNAQQLRLEKKLFPEPEMAFNRLEKPPPIAHQTSHMGWAMNEKTASAHPP